MAESRAGNRRASREHLQAVVAEDPQHEAAWHWLSAVADSSAEAAVFLRKVLEINPVNAQAEDDLRRCQEELAALHRCPLSSAATQGENEQCPDCGGVLPLADADAFVHRTRLDAGRIRAMQTSAASLEAWSGPCVLVVDPSADVRNKVTEVLERQGFRVVAAADGNEAAERARQVTPDLIFVAVDLPDVDGYQVCRGFKAQRNMHDVPVVMLTTKNGLFEKLRGRFAGCQDYLPKTVSSARLLEVAREYTSPR